MTRFERERLIERYMSGDMGPAEESDFFLQVALDKELRQELQAQRTIESALRKDRESEPAEHTSLRSRIEATLASASVDSPVSRPLPRPARWFTKPIHWFTAALVATGVTVAVMFFPGDAPSPSPAARPAAPGSPAGQAPEEAAPNAVQRSTGVQASGSSPTTERAPAAASARNGEAPEMSAHERTSERSVTEVTTDRSGRSRELRRSPHRTSQTSIRRENRRATAIVDEPLAPAGQIDTTEPVQSSKDPLNVGVEIKIQTTEKK